MYTLTLTEQDIETICFVSSRYCWSDTLQSLGVSEGENTLTEPEAWELYEAIEADMEGGHDVFPMLDPGSDLASKLAAFHQSVV